MKRVAHPVCCGCGSPNPDYESDRFNMRVCYRCLFNAAGQLIRTGFADRNPLMEELFDGVWPEQSLVEKYLVWYPTPGFPHRASQVWVERLNPFDENSA